MRCGHSTGSIASTLVASSSRMLLRGNSIDSGRSSGWDWGHFSGRFLGHYSTEDIKRTEWSDFGSLCHFSGPV